MWRQKGQSKWRVDSTSSKYQLYWRGFIKNAFARDRDNFVPISWLEVSASRWGTGSQRLGNLKKAQLIHLVCINCKIKFQLCIMSITFMHWNWKACGIVKNEVKRRGLGGGGKGSVFNVSQGSRVWETLWYSEHSGAHCSSISSSCPFRFWGFIVCIVAFS